MAGFTLVDVMIVVVVLGILAAAVLPLVSHYIDDSEDAAAHATLDATRKALEMHRAETGEWPTAITNDLFLHGEPPTLPPGYEFNYDPLTGAIALVETAP